VGLTPGNARHLKTSKRLSRPIQLECLACGSVRVAYGYGTEETGHCPQCSYVGWTYAQELDGWETRRIMDGDSEPLTTTQRSVRPTRLLAQTH
jgi:hypothetical protein